MGEFWGIGTGIVLDDKDGVRRIIEPGMVRAAVLDVSARRLMKARCKINIAVVGYQRKL